MNAIAHNEWDALCESAHPGQVLSATLNADDTAVEEGFAQMSSRWYEIALLTLEGLLDRGENNYPDYV